MEPTTSHTRLAQMVADTITTSHTRLAQMVADTIFDRRELGLQNLHQKIQEKLSVPQHICQ